MPWIYRFINISEFYQIVYISQHVYEKFSFYISPFGKGGLRGIL
jgi:hypothetical protein